MLFSIVIPVYNVEKYLNKCLESIKRQTYSDFEVILVNDGSTDNSCNICNDFVKKDCRFKVIHKENGGVVSARQSGVMKTQGEYIITIDGDDYIGMNHLRNIYEGIIKYNYPDCISFGYTATYNNYENIVEDVLENKLYVDEELSYIKNAIIYDSNKKGANLGLGYSIWRRCIKKDLLIKYQLTVDKNIDNGDDLVVIAPLVQEVKTYAVIENYEYHYVKYNNASITSGFRFNAFDNLKAVISNLESKLDDRHQNSIDVYATIQLWRIVCLAAIHFDSYRKFVEYIKKNIDSSLKQHCKDAKISHASKADRLRIMTLKNEWYILAWIAMLNRK